MAKQLNLNAKWTGDTLRISWNDVKANDQNKAAAIIMPIAIFVLFIWSGGVALTDGGFGFMGLVLVGSLVAVIWYRSGSTTVPNHVDFTAKSITFRGRKYQTTSITRFDYGVKSQLTGITPQKDGNGNAMSDPTLVRMWVNDSAPVTISENNWSFDVCHEIRDALDQALTKVRTDQKEAVKEALFGKSGEFGVPDY